MRHLKKFKYFTEALAISTTDRPDEKHAKQDFNTSSEELQQYFRVKPKIDVLYNSANTDTELEIGWKNLLNQEKVKQFGKFVVDYEKICRIQREIERANNDRVIAQANKSTTVGDKASKEINDKITSFSKILAEKTKQMKDLMNDHKKLIDDAKKNLKDDEKEIRMKS